MPVAWNQSDGLNDMEYFMIKELKKKKKNPWKITKTVPSTCLKVSDLSLDSNLQIVQRHNPALLIILLDTSASISE